MGRLNYCGVRLAAKAMLQSPQIKARISRWYLGVTLTGPSVSTAESFSHTKGNRQCSPPSLNSFLLFMTSNATKLHPRQYTSHSTVHTMKKWQHLNTAAVSLNQWIVTAVFDVESLIQSSNWISTVLTPNYGGSSHSAHGWKISRRVSYFKICGGW